MDYQKPRGTRDIYGPELKLINQLNNFLQELALLNNYQEIVTPVLEYENLFKRTVGIDTDIVQKEMFMVYDRHDHAMVLKPEGTAPAIRAALENRWLYSSVMPVKLFYNNALMFRYERPQKGRYRQFAQFGVEFFGIKAPANNFELMNLAYSIFHDLHIKESIKIEINFLGSKDTQSRYTADLRSASQYLKLCEDCQKRWTNNPLRILDCKVDHEVILNNLPVIENYLDNAEKEEFLTIQSYLKASNIPFTYNPLLVRGIDYYTGFVFEFKDKQDDNFTVLAGGQYDNLVEQISGNLKLAACGFAVGIDRLAMFYQANAKKDLFKIHNNRIDVYLTVLKKDSLVIAYANNIANDIRKAGFKIDVNYNADVKLKNKFKYSAHFKPYFIIFIGQQELETQKVRTKNQTTAQEESVNVHDIVNFLKKLLK